MATKFTSIYKQELKSKGLLSSMGSAVLKNTRERMDVRNMLFGGKGMLSATGQKVFGRGYSALSSGTSSAPSAEQSSATNDLLASGERQEALLRIVAKNTFNMNMMARDMNITRQNIAKITKSATGKSAKTQDALWYNAKERDSLFKKTPTKAGEKSTESKGSGIFGGLGDLFSGGASLLGAVVSGLLGTVGAVGGGILSTIGSVLKFIPGGFLIGIIALAGVAYLIQQVSDNVNFSGLKNDILKGLGLDPDNKENSLTKQILMKLGFSEGTAGKIDKTFTDIGQTFSNIFEPVVSTMLIHSKAAFNTLVHSFSILGEEFKYQADKLFNENRGKIFAAIALGFMGPAVLLSPKLAAGITALAAGFGYLTGQKSKAELEQEDSNLTTEIDKRTTANAVNRKPADVRPLYPDPSRPGMKSIMELYNAGGIGLSTLSAREQEMAKLENERIEVRAALELKKREEEISNQRQDKLKNLPKTLQEYYLEEVARDTGIKAADDALANRKPSNSPSQLSTNQKIGNYRISSPFGNRLNPFTGQGMESHEGIDIAMPKGTPLYAIVDGKIVAVGNNSVAGNFVTLKDSKGTEYTYSHLDSTEVTSGQEVKQGNLIGKSGNTGRSTAPHLHFGVKEQGKFREPVLQELQNAISQAQKISDASIENQDQRIALTLSDLAPSAPSITVGPTTNVTQAGGGRSASAYDMEGLFVENMIYRQTGQA